MIAIIRHDKIDFFQFKILVSITKTLRMAFVNRGYQLKLNTDPNGPLYKHEFVREYDPLANQRIPPAQPSIDFNRAFGIKPRPSGPSWSQATTKQKIKGVFAVIGCMAMACLLVVLI